MQPNEIQTHQFRILGCNAVGGGFHFGADAKIDWSGLVFSFFLFWCFLIQNTEHFLHKTKRNIFNCLCVQHYKWLWHFSSYISNECVVPGQIWHVDMRPVSSCEVGNLQAPSWPGASYCEAGPGQETILRSAQPGSVSVSAWPTLGLQWLGDNSDVNIEDQFTSDTTDFFIVTG